MARNRKRAKERRARRPQAVPSRLEREVERVEHEIEQVVHDIDALGEDAPDPIAHATPDVELAEAQVALGRPDLADASQANEVADELEAEPAALGGGRGRRGAAVDAGLEGDGGDGGGAAAVPAPRAVPGNRLVNFLQGSWRELQRVQWPDRRQVMQATGVVIGFVIIAGVFLGVADLLAGKLMNFVLK